MDKETKRLIILENASNPYHKELKDDTYIKVRTNNESCVDDITLFIKINDNYIEEVFFEGEACAITTSTTSIMIKILEGKKIDEALEIIRNYKSMINEEDYKEELLLDAIVYDEIYKQANRKNCALLPWNGIYDKLIEYKEAN